MHNPAFTSNIKIPMLHINYVKIVSNLNLLCVGKGYKLNIFNIIKIV